jgi:serine/threonine-protein kinase
MGNDTERWEALQALFHLAADTPEARLDSVLLEACAGAELRARAKALILAAREDAAEPAAVGVPALSGRIGPYSVIRPLGSGGIGTVYLVERLMGGVVQRAALKVLSLHAAGPAFVDRFAREQHILASLDHPNITHMLDAGLSANGEPYLVMEYVEGQHLDAYCDGRALPIDARLQLFLRICEAVAYAHRSLIVHLDLKPSNILVTEAEGTVKLLDFGTSKLIEFDSLATATVMATPAYASPEQLRNEPVTTACDVYALGAILFELLCGRRPNQGSSVAMMIERSIQELPPEPIALHVTADAAKRRGLSESGLSSVLRGDLATIAAKCLSPLPKDRYASVDVLIADVQRYLDGRPILARPQTTAYRMAKFVRRNRKAVAAGVLAVLALSATSGYALWRQHQAVVAGRRALQMQTFMYRLFKLANSDYLGKPTLTVPDFLQLGVKVLPDLIKDPADQRAARLSLAESMFDNGDMVHAEEALLQVIADAKAAGDVGTEAEAAGFAGYAASMLGQTGQGKALTDEALRLLHKAGVTPSARAWIEVYAAATHQNLGFASPADLALMKAALDESRKQNLPERETAFILISYAEFQGITGHIDEGERYLRKALAIYDRDPYALCDRSVAYVDLGYLADIKGNVQESLELFQRAYEGQSRCKGPDNERTLRAQQFVAREMLKVGEVKQAVAILEAALPAWRRAIPDGTDLYFGLAPLGTAYNAEGSYAKAETVARELIALQTGKTAPNGARMTIARLVLAEALAGQHRYREALPLAEAVDASYAAGLVPNPMEAERRGEAHRLLLDLRAKVGATVR